MKKFFVLIVSSLLVGQVYAMSSPRKKLHNQEDKIYAWWLRDDFKLYADRMHFKSGQNCITLVSNPNVNITPETMQICLDNLNHFTMEFCVESTQLIAALNQTKPIFILSSDEKYYALNIIVAKYVQGKVNSFETGRLKEALRPIVQQVAREVLFEKQGYVYLEEDNEYHMAVPESPRQQSPSKEILAKAKRSQRRTSDGSTYKPPFGRVLGETWSPAAELNQ